MVQQIDALKTGERKFKIICNDRGLAIYVVTARGIYLVLVVAANERKGDGSHIMDLLNNRCRNMKGRKRILITLPECLQKMQDFYTGLGFRGEEGAELMTELQWEPSVEEDDESDAGITKKRKREDTATENDEDEGDGDAVKKSKTVQVAATTGQGLMQLDGEKAGKATEADAETIAVATGQSLARPDDEEAERTADAGGVIRRAIKKRLMMLKRQAVPSPYAFVHQSMQDLLDDSDGDNGGMFVED